MNTPKLPPLPKPDTHCFDEDTGKDVWSHSPEQMQAYALAAIKAQGVPDGWQLVPKEPTDEMVRAALHLDLSYMPGHDGPDRAAVYKAMLASAPPAPQKLTTCNCRWDGDTQVQHCTLHQAHIDAIHEWAERAKTAEAELAAQQQKPLTDEQDRALCEAYSNAASDEYFKARPQLDSDVNRRIFYAGHRKAWIEWQAAPNIGEKK